MQQIPNTIFAYYTYYISSHCHFSKFLYCVAYLLPVPLYPSLETTNLKSSRLCRRTDSTNTNSLIACFVWWLSITKLKTPIAPRSVARTEHILKWYAFSNAPHNSRFGNFFFHYRSIIVSWDVSDYQP